MPATFLGVTLTLPLTRDKVSNLSFDQCRSCQFTGDICPAGHYCPRGSPRPLPCRLGQYCQHAGLPSPTAACYAAYYCNDSSTVPDQFECPVGHYCPNGTGIPKACPAGTFSNTVRNTKVDNCRNCTAGSFCAGTGNFAPTRKCSARYYCPGGQQTATPSEFLCTAGHHCPEGSDLPKPCGNGTYQNEVGQSSCKICPERWYCDGTNGPVVNATICPKGHYCPEGTSSYRDFPCPESECDVFFSTILSVLVCVCALSLSSLFVIRNAPLSGVSRFVHSSLVFLPSLLVSCVESFCHVYSFLFLFPSFA